MLAVSAGDPGTGWGLTLGAHHALVVGAYFSEDGQRDIFGPSGDFRCPHRPPPMGTAEPAGGASRSPASRTCGCSRCSSRPASSPRGPSIIFATAGSSPAKRGTRLQRYYRDVAMYRGHIAAQHLATAGELARVHFGLPDTLF
jgi:hypothetical protein